jgi:hypothetical protein
MSTLSAARCREYWLKTGCMNLPLRSPKEANCRVGDHHKPLFLA